MEIVVYWRAANWGTPKMKGCHTWEEGIAIAKAKESEGFEYVSIVKNKT